MAYFKCSGENPTGNAVEADVLSGKTFSNENGTDKTGTMPNRGAVSQTLDTSTTSYTIPAGYHNGNGIVSVSTQTKSATPGTSAQTIAPDAGKVLSSVSVAAISPVRSAGTAAVASGIDSTGPYVYFPYGWWPNGGSSRNYTRMTAAQAVAACPSEQKSSAPTTRSATAATVTPSSGKLLSKVIVNTNSVPNSNSGTKTITSSDTNWLTGNVDMGAANTYRYVNAVNVYNKGKTDGVGSCCCIGHKNTSMNTSIGEPSIQIPVGPNSSPTFYPGFAPNTKNYIVYMQMVLDPSDTSGALNTARLEISSNSVTAASKEEITQSEYNKCAFNWPTYKDYIYKYYKCTFNNITTTNTNWGTYVYVTHSGSSKWAVFVTVYAIDK